MSSDQQPKKKRRHAGGMPAYKPTDQERRCVAIMSGFGMPTAMIRAAIGGRGKSGKLSKNALWRHFRKELEGGAARMHELVASKLWDAVSEGKPWAVMAAARNLSGFKWDNYGKTAVPVIADDGDDPQIKIEFVYPRKPTAIDVTPPPPTAYPPDSKPNDDVPAIAAPPERVKTEFGIVEHRGPTYQNQMGSDPPSIFHRPGDRDWMR
jgi:hypothetical protein